MVNDKRLHNRFDEFEIASVFTEYAEEWLPKKWQLVRTQFYIKCLLGVLLFLNGYLSHWGPWPWPSNYYFLIFSVVFYHVATHFYGLQTPVKNHEGNTVVLVPCRSVFSR
jgi:predicted membrane channel-forming protein YqfA (hemolysin III family)